AYVLFERGDTREHRLELRRVLVVVERRLYFPLVAFLLVEWGLLFFLAPDPSSAQTHASNLFTAAVVGIVANDVRRRGLRHDAESAIAYDRRGAELQKALQEAHESAEALRVFSESSTEGIVIHREGVLVAANDAFWAMFRLPRGHRGGAMADRVAPESRALVAKRMQEHLEGPARIVMLRGDGTSFPAEVEARNIVHAGAPARIAIVRDLSALEVAESGRRKSEEADRVAFERLLEIQQLRRLDEFKTQFLNTASHELNTPITPVRLQLHLLKAGQFGPLSAEQQHSVEVIDRNVGRLAGLVQDLLDVARLQGGQMRLQRAAIDLRRLAEEAVEAFVPQAASAGVALALVPGAPAHLRADGRRLTQVLFNLLSNAIKFTPRGGAVRVAVAASGPGAWRVDVTDTGAGLDDSQVARLFQPFSQVHEDPALRHAGTGLGLYICRGIVEAHGGRMWATSPGPGKGSTFAVEVPHGPPDAP
ncbi:MAG: ATP-binding protein, partial [Thermoplasmatota archaeon]